jgi:hypothetical protein
MNHFYPIIYQNKDKSDRVRGFDIPIFIHNGNYYLVSLELYEDGLVHCWELIELDRLPQKVSQGWVNLQAPIGATIGIHDLGNAIVKDVDWLFPNEAILEIAQKGLEELNPTKQNLKDVQSLKQEQAAKLNIPAAMIGVSRWRPHPYRITKKGEEILGRKVPLFYSQPEETLLTNCIVYSDGTASLGSDKTLLPLSEIQKMLDAEILMTSVEDDTWVTILGLGRFQVASGWWRIEKDEVWKEIRNLFNVLNGQTDLVSLCFQAFLAYQSNPSEGNRELLRDAYEAVPKHHRVYTQGSQDDKDNDIKRILYRDPL